MLKWCYLTICFAFPYNVLCIATTEHHSTEWQYSPMPAFQPFTLSEFSDLMITSLATKPLLTESYATA